MTKARTVGKRQRDKGRRQPAALPMPEPFVIVAPTPEAMRQNAYAKLDVGGRKAYVRCEPALIDKLRMLTRQQREAGKAFAADYARAWTLGGHRDVLDMSPRGGRVHETQTQAEAWARAKARLHTVLNRTGPKVYSILVQVCAFEEPLGDRRRLEVYAALNEGLNVCARVYGVPEYEV